MDTCFSISKQVMILSNSMDFKILFAILSKTFASVMPQS